VKAILEMKGFKNIDVKPESNETQAAGTILTQFPEIGEEVIPTEETIEFTVSTGPKQVTINELVGKSKEEIDEYVSANGFITSVSEEHSSDIPKGHLISQTPEPGTKVVPRETTLQLVYSSGPEELPRKTVTKTVDIPYNPEIVGQEQEVSILIDDAEHSISDTYKTFKISSPKVETLNFTIESGQVAYYQIIIDNEVVTSETIPYPND
jgi:serine/threonine-protein kinase